MRCASSASASHSGIALGQIQNRILGCISGNIHTGLDLAIDLNGDFNHRFFALCLVKGRPGLIGDGTAKPTQLPGFFGHVGRKGIQQKQQGLVFPTGDAADV